MSLSHLRPLTAGEILDGGFVLFRRHFAALLTAALLPSLPVAAYWVLVTAADAVPEVLPPALSLYDTLATTLLLGALIEMSAAALRGEEVSVRAAYARARDRFWRLVGVSILSGVAAMLGLVLLVIPGILVFLFLFLSSHAVMLEDRRVTDALERSWALARPQWRRVTGVLLVTFVIVLLPFLLIGTTELVVGVQSAWALGASQVLQTLLLAMLYAFAGPVTTVLYFDCRVRRDGLDLEVATESLAPLPA